MTIGWMCAVPVLCAVLYLLGWERGHRGATVWRSVKRALAARRQRLERAAPGGEGRKGARPAEAAPAWGKPQMAAPGGATEAGGTMEAGGATEAGAAGRSTAPTGARAAAGKAGRGAADNRNPAGTNAAGRNAAGRGAADNRNPVGRNAAGMNAAGRMAAGADPAQAGAGTQAGRNTGEPANGRALQELLNFLQYDGTPQPPPGGHNR